MRKQMILPALAAGLAMVLSAAAPRIETDTEFRVKLLAPLNTDTNKKGDKVTAQVVAPEAFKGMMMEGEVRESKSGKKIKGQSVLSLGFNKLIAPQEEIPVRADIKSFVNSKGQQDVDEEGRVIEKKNRLGYAAAATGVGALIGGIAGGGKGAAIGAAVGGAASLLVIQLGTKGPSISFAPGSEIIMTVREEGERRKL